MIYTRCPLNLSGNDHEDVKSVSPDFPAEGYDELLNQEPGCDVPWHWHEELEAIVVPKLRRLALEVSRSGDRDAFLAELPHRWYEGYLVHAFVLNETSEVADAVRLLDALLPFVDNWCVCDALNPRAFHNEKALGGQQQEVLLPLAQRWMASEHTFTRRFGVSILMRDLLGEGFHPSSRARSRTSSAASAPSSTARARTCATGSTPRTTPARSGTSSRGAASARPTS